MQRTVLHASHRYHWRKLVVGVAVVGIGAGLLALGRGREIAWGLVALGGVYALLQLRALGEEQERLVIDDSGIRDSLLPVGTIGWDEIRGASVQEIGPTPVVALQVRDPEQFIRRLPPGRQFIARKALEAGLPGLYLTLVGTDGDPHAVAKAINEEAGRRTGGQADGA